MHISETAMVGLQHQMRAIVESWLKVQSAWLYLEPIFGSQDIRNQIPVEGNMFEEVDSHWYVNLVTRTHCSSQITLFMSSK